MFPLLPIVNLSGKCLANEEEWRIFASGDKTLPAVSVDASNINHSMNETREEKEIKAKLEELKKAMFRNEQRMREAFVKFEELVAQRESVVSSIDALRAFRNKKRR